MSKVSVAQRASEPSNRTALMRNLRAVFLLRGAQRLMLIASILVPFFVHYGQDIQEIFWLESFYELTVLLMEVPSGCLAYAWSIPRPGSGPRRPPRSPQPPPGC